MPEIIKGDERLLNLTLALLHTEFGLTKDQIIENVQGYKEQLGRGESRDSLVRKFERDKETLEKTGIKCEYITPLSDDKNNQNGVYRISRERFEWPKDTKKLTDHQVMLLNLAGRAWNQNSMSSDAARGLFKLRALADVKGSSELIGIAPRIRTHHPTFSALNQACAEHEVIQFSYRKPQDSAAEKRTLQPWKLSNVDGQWLVTGWDEKRKDVRNFLLQRITPAEIRPTKRHFEPPTEADLAAAKQSLEDLIATQVAVLRVKPSTRAWLHFGMDLESTTGSTQKQINYMDLYLLAAELRHFGSDVEVVAPESLKVEIRKGFEKVASLHHG